ncbi:unnamed protein product, partial [Amoebophrya sp. A25]|eukprot:GSA25T00010535001.1
MSGEGADVLRSLRAETPSRRQSSGRGRPAAPLTPLAVTRGDPPKRIPPAGSTDENSAIKSKGGLSLRSKFLNFVEKQAAPELDDAFFESFPRVILGCWQLRSWRIGNELTITPPRGLLTLASFSDEEITAFRREQIRRT